MPNGAPRALEAGRVTVAVSAVDWLLESDEPGIVAQAKRDLLDEVDPPEAAQVLDGPKVRALLAGQRADGGFGVNVYGKWGGAHWRLVSLVELGVPAGEPRCLAAAETVLAWLTGRGHRDRIQVIGGLTRRCAGQEGNRPGRLLPTRARRRPARSPARGVARRVAVARRGLELRQEGNRIPLVVQRVATSDVGPTGVLGGDRRDGRARGGGAHRRAVLRAPPLPCACDGRADPRVVRHAALAAVLALRLPPGARRARTDGARVRPGAADGLDLLEERRLPDGCWRAGGRWRRPPGPNGSNVEVVDWGSGPSELLTLHALRVLRAAGRSRPEPARARSGSARTTAAAGRASAPPGPPPPGARRGPRT